MSKAVAETGGDDEESRHGKSGAPCHSESGSEEDHRGEDAMFHCGKMSASKSEDASKEHGSHEGAREEPERTSSEFGGPESHRHHHQQVIEAGEGVEEARLKCRPGILRVELGRMGHCRESGSEEEWQGKEAFHGIGS